jgi:hypothetical protein
MRKKKPVCQSISGGKKKWVRPMLIVLVRGGDRSEGVLAGCKVDAVVGSNTIPMGCRVLGFACFPKCDALSPS